MTREEREKGRRENRVERNRAKEGKDELVKMRQEKRERRNEEENKGRKEIDKNTSTKTIHQT